MEFHIGDYRVVVREGKSKVSMDVVFGHHPGLRYVYIDAPEELMHPMYQNFFRLRLKGIIDSVAKKQSMNSTSRYIPNRERAVKWAVRKFKYEFSQVHGDIEVIRESWDYNKSPVKSEGKFGDLKGFLEMRKGGSLDLGGGDDRRNS